MNKNVRKLTEGAMMVALVGVALFINRQLAGLLEFSLYWVLTFPILIYTVKYGVRNALAVGVSMVLLSFMISMPTTMFYLAVSIVIGMVYGGGVRKKWSNRTLIFVTGIFTFLSYLITMVVFASFFGYDPNEDMEMLRMVLDTFKIAGINIGQAVKLFSLLITVLLSVMQTLCIHLISIILMRYLKLECNPVKTMFDFRLPKLLGYISIIIWVLFLGQSVLKLNEDMTTYLFGIYLIMRIITMADGCVAIMCMLALRKKQIWSLLLLAVIFTPYINNFISVIGVCDIISEARLRLLKR